MGSVSLTDEIHATIVGLLRKGVFLHVAAEVAGVSHRTVDDWIARGEGRHPTRSSTPKLRRFAKDVRVAQALSRIDAETLLLELIDELDRAEEAETTDTPPRRGRPPGSVSLTEEIQRTIVTFIRAGAFITSAAEAAGIGRSTFFEWMARGEGRHKTRPMTRKLRRFAQEVNRAHAQARASAEARVHDRKPLHWLRYGARTDGEAVGWGEPLPLGDRETDPRSPGLLEIWLQELDDLSDAAERPQPPSSTGGVQG